MTPEQIDSTSIPLTLGIVALGLFLMLGYGCSTEANRSIIVACIESGQQWVDGNCVSEADQ